MGLALERIVYTSRARGDADSLLMQVDILATSQRNNARDDLTGALMIHDGRFLQVLEGAAQDLDRLMIRLADDRRHEAVTIMERIPVSERRFTGWAMASVRVTPALEPLLRETVADGRSSTEAVERMRQAVMAQSA
ncbi:BLUF domain-containing protein [Brevundimonas sp.]|uniref:BLUF domain-containing protein n=1 Tax=Brevundimonas sp. TaxID=1871086 RepID=UPI00289DE303|nr:BLUF domain-containing protein [Brevundimonas sp.]